MIKFIHPTKRTLQMWHLHKFHIQKITEVTSFMFGEEIITEKVEDIFLDVEIKKEAMEHTEEFFGDEFTFIHPENIDFWGLGGLQNFVHRLRESQINK